MTELIYALQSCHASDKESLWAYNKLCQAAQIRHGLAADFMELKAMARQAGLIRVLLLQLGETIGLCHDLRARVHI